MLPSAALYKAATTNYCKKRDKIFHEIQYSSSDVILYRSNNLQDLRCHLKYFFLGCWWRYRLWSIRGSSLTSMKSINRGQNQKERLMRWIDPVLRSWMITRSWASASSSLLFLFPIELTIVNIGSILQLLVRFILLISIKTVSHIETVAREWISKEWAFKFYYPVFLDRLINFRLKLSHVNVGARVLRHKVYYATIYEPEFGVSSIIAFLRMYTDHGWL